VHWRRRSAGLSSASAASDSLPQQSRGHPDGPLKAVSTGHAAHTLAACAERGIRSYVPERKAMHRRRWKDKPEGWKRAVYGNRRRRRRTRDAALQHKRSEYVERSFAHTCETGRGRRSHLRGIYDVGKRWLGHLAGRNLGVLMRSLTGMGRPRGIQREAAVPAPDRTSLWGHLARILSRLEALLRPDRQDIPTGC